MTEIKQFKIFIRYINNLKSFGLISLCKVNVLIADYKY